MQKVWRKKSAWNFEQIESVFVIPYTHTQSCSLIDCFFSVRKLVFWCVCVCAPFPVAIHISVFEKLVHIHHSADIHMEHFQLLVLFLLHFFPYMTLHSIELSVYEIQIAKQIHVDCNVCVVVCLSMSNKTKMKKKQQHTTRSYNRFITINGLKTPIHKTFLLC